VVLLPVPAHGWQDTRGELDDLPTSFIWKPALVTEELFGRRILGSRHCPFTLGLFRRPYAKLHHRYRHLACKPAIEPVAEVRQLRQLFYRGYFRGGNQREDVR
jgi:hypothetical protein